MTNEGHWPIPVSVVSELPLPPDVHSREPRGASVPFSGSRFAVDWLKHVVEVHQRDKIAERKKKVYLWWLVISCVVAFIAIPMGCSRDSESPVPFVIGGIAVVAAVFCLVRRLQYNALDVEDYRLEAFSGTVLTMAPELNVKKPIDAKLDFTAFTKHRDGSAAGEAFCQRWLELSLPLQDGSCASLAVTLSVKQKSRRKRKYTKLKQRQVEAISVRLTPPAGKAFNLASAAPAHRGKVISGMLLHRVAIQPRAASFVWTVPPTVVLYNRSGWSSPSGMNRVGSRHLVAALVASYQLTASGERHAAA
jgi:hypothetical protein